MEAARLNMGEGLMRPSPCELASRESAARAEGCAPVAPRQPEVLVSSHTTNYTRERDEMLKINVKSESDVEDSAMVQVLATSQSHVLEDSKADAALLIKKEGNSILKTENEMNDIMVKEELDIEPVFLQSKITPHPLPLADQADLHPRPDTHSCDDADSTPICTVLTPSPLPNGTEDKHWRGDLGVPPSAGFVMSRRCSPSTPKADEEEEVINLWNAAKLRFPKKEDLMRRVQHEIEQLLREAAERKARTALPFVYNEGDTKSFNSISTQIKSNTQNVPSVECVSQSEVSIKNVQYPESVAQVGTADQQSRDQNFDHEPQPAGPTKRKSQPIVISDDEDEVTSTSTPPAVRPTPAQDVIKKKIDKLRVDLNLLGDTNYEKALKLRQEIDEWEKKLKLKEKQRMYSMKHRENKKLKLNEICSKYPDAAKSLTPRASPGRPRLEKEQPALLKAIGDLAMFGASDEERRRCEIVRTIHTLSDLTEKLIELGFNISQSATYIRLLPRRANTRETKRHVVTVPVKLSRPEADRHKAHQDRYFSEASIRSLETVASILGPHSVTFLSQDDKARVPIGLTAASEQAPLLMHVEYEVSLPDRDFLIASRHTLIPSVYALCEVKPDEMGRPEAISYSGPTYIAIRSGKHSSSTATSHAEDLNTVINLEPFFNFTKNGNEEVKPVLIISSDGGPDEDPRYRKVIAHAIEHFKKYDLDAIFIVSNAPGRSAYNRVERRMALLSRELTGVVLPHDSFGTHLNSSGRTVDVSLEKENFKKAGEILADIWSAVCIDGHEVVAKYIEPNNDTSTVPDLPAEEWYTEHVRESQYLLQVVKCDNRECCGLRRSALHMVLHDRFIPPPYPITQINGRMTIPESKEHDGRSFAPFLIRHCLPIQPSHAFISMPYDLYCPSLRGDLEKRCCCTCGIYFASITKVAEHRRAAHDALAVQVRKVRPSRIVTRRASELLCASDDGLEWLNQNEVEGANDFIENNEDMLVPIVTLETVHESPWTELE